MPNNKYIIKNLTPWMIDELIAFSEMTGFDLILLREQNEFHRSAIDRLKKNGIRVFIRPFNNIISFSKILTVFKFTFSNFLKIGVNYNGVIFLKSIIWFLRLDLSIFSKDSNIHAQFATQPAIISMLIKQHFKDLPSYSFTFHAYDIYFKNKWLELLINNSKYAFSCSAFNVKYISGQYPKANPKKIVISRMGVFQHRNHIRTKRSQYRAIKVGLMSWFVKKKGIIYLLESVKKVVDNKFDIRLTLAGDGPLKNNILEYIASNGINNYISYVGKISGGEKEKFFNDIDVFVLPSIPTSNDMDGIPFVLMEAISYGIPIISTRVSGIPEICMNNVNGFLVPPHNSVKLSEAIIKFIEMSDYEYLEFSRNALNVGKDYDIRKNSQNKLIKMGFIQ